MNKHFTKILLSLLVISSISCVQQEKKETIIANEKEIVSNVKSTQEIIQPSGNLIFKKSKKLNELKWTNGYILDSINVENCKGLKLEKTDLIDSSKIKDIIFNQNSFTINLSSVENCCSNFLCEAEIIDDTLNIIYHTYGSQCSCKCNFDLSYTFKYNKGFERIKAERSRIEFVSVNRNSNSKIKFEKYNRPNQ